MSEAYRIRLAHLFDPYLAVHTSIVDPLPHQITQRRLASSPEAIYQSLKRRRERLEKRLAEEKLLKRGSDLLAAPPSLSVDEIEDLEDAPDAELEETEEQVVDQATAARTIAELEAEIATLLRLEKLAQQVRLSGADRKWDELNKIFQNDQQMFDEAGNRTKLIIFTEHRDTLNYLAERIRTTIGRSEAVVTIQGGMPREERRNIQERFRQDKEVLVLVATDAAGEGVNLQRAHLMVSYDLPWNPNRLEQRFGRIHRIGQTEVCHLWNLVARETREGEVFHRLFEKLEHERKALGGRVFDVLGKLTFDNKPLKELLIEAIRYGDLSETKAKLFRVVDNALDRQYLCQLLEDRALAKDSMDIRKVMAIREEMERIEARRLQPHFISAFFMGAFKLLGGTIREREPRCFEITHVPAVIRNRDRLIGTGEAVLNRYERICFEKELVNVQGKPLAALVCPGHPLLDATIDLILERYRDVLKQGAVLVDESSANDHIRALVYIENAIQDARPAGSGQRRIVSKQVHFVELGEDGSITNAGYAPYLDYRPLQDSEKAAASAILQGQWLNKDIEKQAVTYAITELVPKHLSEIKSRKTAMADKIMQAVKERLTREIAYWDHRSAALREQKLAGKPNARLNSEQAAKRAEELQGRLQKRMEELEQEKRLSPLPPVVIGGALIVPAKLLKQDTPQPDLGPGVFGGDTKAIEDIAMKTVIKLEKRLGYLPQDVSADKCGYDIESKIPGTGKLRFLEVKGRTKGAATITVTKNEILTALNKPDDYILAVVEVDGNKAKICYLQKPFAFEPDFAATSVNYSLSELVAGSRVILTEEMVHDGVYEEID